MAHASLASNTNVTTSAPTLHGLFAELKIFLNDGRFCKALSNALVLFSSFVILDLCRRGIDVAKHGIFKPPKLIWVCKNASECLLEDEAKL